MTLKFRNLSASLLALIFSTLTTNLAFARDPGFEDGSEPGQGITAGYTILVFFVIPIVISAIVAAAAWATSGKSQSTD